MIKKALWTAGRGALALGMVAFAGCSSEATPAPAPVPVEQTPTDTGAVEIGQWTGHWNAETKQLTFDRVEKADTAPDFKIGTAEQGFAQVASGKLTFATQWAVMGPDVAQGCPAGQLCALVSLTNDSTRDLFNTFVEVTSLTPTGYEGSNSDAVPGGYPMTNTYGLWGYSDLPASGGGADREWRFNQPGTASFSFQTRVMATFARSSYAKSNGSLPLTGSWSDSAPTWRDACSMAGSTTVLQNAVPGDSAILTMPFPVGIYDWTFATDWDEMTISTVGSVGLFPVDSATNSALPDGNLAGNLFGFWDDIYTGAEGVCYASTGSSPNRYFVVTWPKAHITGYPNTWLNFSIVMRETTDDAWILFKRWSDNLTNCTATTSAGALRARGSSATLGIQGLNSEFTQISYNPASATLYPLPVHTSVCTSNGKWFKLTAAVPNNVFP